CRPEVRQRSASALRREAAGRSRSVRHGPRPPARLAGGKAVAGGHRLRGGPRGGPQGGGGGGGGGGGRPHSRAGGRAAGGGGGGAGGAGEERAGAGIPGGGGHLTGGPRTRGEAVVQQGAGVAPEIGGAERRDDDLVVAAARRSHEAAPRRSREPRLADHLEL